MYVIVGWVCIDEQIAIRTAIRPSYVKVFHALDNLVCSILPRNYGGQLRPYKTWKQQKKGVLCTEIGKNLKCIKPKKSAKSIEKAIDEPNQEMQLDFAKPIINRNIDECYKLSCPELFSWYPTAEAFNKRTGMNVVKFWKKIKLEYKKII